MNRLNCWENWIISPKLLEFYALIEQSTSSLLQNVYFLHQFNGFIVEYFQFHDNMAMLLNETLVIIIVWIVEHINIAHIALAFITCNQSKWIVCSMPIVHITRFWLIYSMLFFFLFFVFFDWSWEQKLHVTFHLIFVFGFSMCERRIKVTNPFRMNFIMFACKSQNKYRKRPFSTVTFFCVPYE